MHYTYMYTQGSFFEAPIILCDLSEYLKSQISSDRRHLRKAAIYGRVFHFEVRVGMHTAGHTTERTTVVGARNRCHRDAHQAYKDRWF